MALQSSGAISFSDIQTEFGGSNPISYSEYYKGGTYVPTTVSVTATASNLVKTESGGDPTYNGVFWRYYEAGYGKLPTINDGSTYLYYASFWTDTSWTSGTSTSDVTFEVDSTLNYIASVGGYNTGATRNLTVYVNGSSVGSSSFGSVNFSASAGDTIRLKSTMNTIGNYNACTTTMTTDSGSRTASATVNDDVPTSGVIDLSDFYGAKGSY